MKVFYNIEIQMLGKNEISNELMESASRAFQFLKTDVDELETYRATALFNNEIKPTEMRERVRKFLRLHNDVNYVDVMYRFEYEMVPDRFVVWHDGQEQDYTGHIYFKEDGE